MIPLPERLSRAAALLAAGIAVCGSARAETADGDPLAGLAALNYAELGEARGGMMVNGIPMNFALVMRTTVQDASLHGLETVIHVNDHGGLGSTSSTAIGNAEGVTLTPTPQGFAMGLPSGTTIAHDVLAGQIRTLLSNTNDNVRLNQSTDLNVELPGFNALAQSWYSTSRASRMGVDAVMNGLGRR